MISIEDILSAQSGYYEDVLSILDEYTLYAHYLTPIIGEDPVIGQGYSSPLREDDVSPSFGIYRAKYLKDREFGWKDQGLNLKGDIFSLVQHLFGLPSKKDALRKICGDFGLGQDIDVRPPVRKEPKEKRPVDILIKSRVFRPSELDWFMSKYNTDRKTLTKFQATAFSHYWMYADQTTPFYPRGMSFAYRLFDKYQLYFPTANKAAGERKFINNWNEACLPGFQQLSYKHDRLVIIKAYKDMMCMDTLGICDVVAYRGENVPIPQVFWEHFRKNYKHIYIMVDNDGKSIAPPWDGHSMIYMPQDWAKDPSDVCDRFGPAMLKEYTLRSMAQIDKYEDQLNRKYAGKCITLNTIPSYTGKVDRVAIEILSEQHQKIVFFFAAGGGLDRKTIDLSEAKEIIHVHS